LLDSASPTTSLTDTRQHFDRHQPTLDRINLQPITLQHPHPQQWLCLCCVDFNLSVLSIPDNLRIMHIEQCFTTIAQRSSLAKPTGGNRGISRADRVLQ
jgi:hypothetical protein